jgi:predicted nucleic acid-binding protein
MKKYHVLNLDYVYKVPLAAAIPVDELDDMFEKFNEMPKSQVRSIHKTALDNLRKANRYFDEYPEKMQTNKQKYQNMIDDAIIVAVSGNVGFDKQVVFIHPNQVEKLNSLHPDERTINKDEVLLDPNIPVMHLH